jgi:hypothetical protein
MGNEFNGQFQNEETNKRIINILRISKNPNLKKNNIEFLFFFQKNKKS